MYGKEGPLFPAAQSSQRHLWQTRVTLFFLTLCAAGLSYRSFQPDISPPTNAKSILSECALLKAKPGPPSDFHKRTVSDRFEPGTKSILIQNATIWTGGHMGTEVVYGDLLLAGGIIKGLGYLPQEVLERFSPPDLSVLNAEGAWITPGLFDLHSHIGLMSAPQLTGAMDGNSPHGPVTPWVRSVDAIKTWDEAYPLVVAGGVTGGLVLPGSGHAIGGQAFPIKYRKTSERSVTSRVIEFPFNRTDDGKTLRWRHMKHATGENSIKHGTRMDTAWAFRQAYDKARQIKHAQDAFCGKVEKGLWSDPTVKGREFPFDLQWEALVDVLRGRVKVNIHTYETEDIDFLSRLTNEFEFPIAAIHHAHEAYLVPDVLKKMWKGPPAVASFAVNARYKRESYRGSEFASKILADNGIDVVLKSDHPVLNSRHLIFEAQQAHFYSLNPNLALRALTTTSAEVAGFGHRLGKISEGYDADVVIWDSHPLTLGATPKQVFIDGIAQLSDPHTHTKPEIFQRPPLTPNWEREIKQTLEHEGLPPLGPRKRSKTVVFTNVENIWQRRVSGIVNAIAHLDTTSKKTQVTVAVVNGVISCISSDESCQHLQETDAEVVDLRGGAISVALTSFGSPLGLSEINSEPSTSDAGRINALSEEPTSVLGSGAVALEAADALQFGGRDTLYAYRFGVGSAISAWSTGTFQGTSVAFRTGAAHGLQPHAIIKRTAALHVSIRHPWARQNPGPSVSMQIAALRASLRGGAKSDHGEVLSQVVNGKLPLVLEVDSADIMVALIRLKEEIEAQAGTKLKVVFSGALESHLIAEEIASADIGIIVTPVRPYPQLWESRRIVPGPPLTRETAISALLARNVTVGIGVEENWEARNTLLNLAWAALDVGGLPKEDALALASTNFDKLFDIDRGDPAHDDLAVYQGGDMFSLEGRVVAVISPRSGGVDLF